MRVVKEILRPDCKITIFNWNGKYLIKFEQDVLEQTFKIDALELTGEDEVFEIVTDEFVTEVIASFRQMHNLLNKYSNTLR
jgi:hypothetical protein